MQINISDFWILGLLCPHPWTAPGQIWRARLDPALRLSAKFHLDLFIASLSRCEKPQFYHFQLHHPAVAPPSVVKKNLNAGAQLRTFPLSKDTKVVSGFQRVDREVAFTNFVIQENKS